MNLLTPYVDKMVSTFLDKSPQSPEVAHTAPCQQLAWDLSEAKLCGRFMVYQGIPVFRVSRRNEPSGVVFKLCAFGV